MKDESADTSEEGKLQRKEHQKEAKEKEKVANEAKDKILNAVGNERNLKKDAEGFPDRFPSGLAKVNASGNVIRTPIQILQTIMRRWMRQKKIWDGWTVSQPVWTALQATCWSRRI